MRREFELEEWGCASEIKQNLNKIKAAPCKMGRRLVAYFRRISEELGKGGKREKAKTVIDSMYVKWYERNIAFVYIEEKLYFCILVIESNRAGWTIQKGLSLAN